MGGGYGTLVSTNGREWSLNEVETGDALFAVAYGNGRFVAGGPYRLYHSTDGLLWERPATPWTGMSARAITFSGGRFVAVGDKMVFYSPDGREWTNELSPTALGLFAIAPQADGALIAVGQTGAILQSDMRPLSLLSPRLAGRDFSFNISGAPGRLYELQTTPDINSATWTTVAEGICNEQSNSFVEQNASTNTQRFHRFRLR